MRGRGTKPKAPLHNIWEPPKLYVNQSTAKGWTLGRKAHLSLLLFSSYVKLRPLATPTRPTRHYVQREFLAKVMKHSMLALSLEGVIEEEK